MTKWTIKSNGTQIGTSTNETFSYAFNENMSSKDITYTIEAEDNNGCKASMDTKLPKCAAKISLISIECKNTTSSKKSDSVLLVTVSLDKARSEDIEMSARIKAQNINHSATGKSTKLPAGDTQITLEVPGYYPSSHDNDSLAVMALVYVDSSDITITNQRLEGTYVLPNCAKEESIPTINIEEKTINIVNSINYINWVQISGILTYKDDDSYRNIQNCYKKESDGTLTPISPTFTANFDGYGYIIDCGCQPGRAIKNASGKLSFADADVFRKDLGEYITSADEIYLRLDIGASTYMTLSGPGTVRECPIDGYVKDYAGTEFAEYEHGGRNSLISKKPITKIGTINLVQIDYPN